jgi:hypothetical protein
MKALSGVGVLLTPVRRARDFIKAWTLDPIEEPHLGRLIAKCLGQTPATNPSTEHTN